MADVFIHPDPIPGSVSNLMGGAPAAIPEHRRMPENRKVRRELLSIHIFFIVISGTIGMGLFDNSGEILRIAGPNGGIFAFGIVGIEVIFIMEGIAEMIAHWPISNAMFEFVKRFVDKEFALVAGFAYWLAYSVSFGTLICAASNLAARWTWPAAVQNLVFILFAPVALIILNLLGVKWYGNVEVFCGILKFVLVIVSFLTMCAINKLDTEHATPPSRSTFISEGFQHDPAVAAHPGVAILAALPIATYGYIGVEIVAVTAVEAKTPKKSLRLPARNIAWITGLLYFANIIVFYFNVSYKDKHLPGYHLRDGISSGSNSSEALIIIATDNAELSHLSTVLNIFLIIAVLSAANTALYVSSRTLWGVVCDFDAELINSTNPLKRWFSKLSTTTHNKVPGWALLVSFLCFMWIPIVQGLSNNAVSSQNLQQVMSGIATVGVVIVWASQCIAFIRYRAWLWANKDELVGTYAAFDHFSNDNNAIPFTSHLGYFQTFPAWMGLIFCFTIIFIFSTASWWNHKENQSSDIPAAFAAPAGFFVIWVCLKIIRWYRAVDTFEWFIPIGTWIGSNGLKAKIDGLTTAIKSLEGEQNDPPIQLGDVSPGSSQQRLQLDAANLQNRTGTPQSARRGNISVRSSAPSVESAGPSYPLPAQRTYNRDGNSDHNDGQYRYDNSQATGSEVPRSPTHRRM